MAEYINRNSLIANLDKFAQFTRLIRDERGEKNVHRSKCKSKGCQI